MKIKNIGLINFDNENIPRPGCGTGHNLNKNTPDNVWHLRCEFPTPTNFRQKGLSDIWGVDFIDNAKKVLEIGFGCGRNAQFFVNETNHIKFYGFDSSSVGLKYFKKQGFPSERCYASLDIDEEILSQEYDLIFSTFVLQHIGFSSDKEVFDANRITEMLWPTLKVGGYLMLCEGNTGDNEWGYKRWFDNFSKMKNYEVIFNKPYELEGSVVGEEHNLCVIRKT